jgi:hypothetical protein
MEVIDNQMEKLATRTGLENVTRPCMSILRTALGAICRRISKNSCQRGDTKRRSSSRMLAKTLLSAALFAVPLHADDIQLHWKFSQPVKINTNSSATHLVLSVDPEKLDQPYFPVYGGLTAVVDDIMILDEPVSGSCRGDGPYFLCQIQNGTMALRIYRRSSSYVMVFVERSPVGEQGPFSLLAD